ncbi:MAG: transketolase family protein [Nocardioidaceae bacterium]|nr:transketolase family protein [Nocardioidaceae bacterium]
MEIVVRPHVDNFVAWSKDKPEVVVMTADLTNSCEVGPWAATYPDRFFSMKMAEQNMMGFAAGLAREGLQPWIHTFAVFIYRRPYDQLAMSIAYPNLPVRFVGFLPGITTPGGVTHQAIEDVAIMRATPNMTILETADATEVESVLDVAHAVDGPVYIRMLRGEVPRLFPREEPMALDRVRILREGDDVTVFSSGITTEETLRATEPLAAAGVEVTHVHVSTHKPFRDPLILESIRRARHGVITLENHSVVGGLGSAVAEVMAENGVGTRLLRLGLRDTYAHGASKSYLMKHYGLDAAALVRGVEDLLGRSTGISDVDLETSRVEAVHSLAKAEAL